MSFFDKKEEVMHIELTQYGKHLLSKGEFAPVYYSFFDDDITYDWQYTGDSAEEQNYAQDRILTETPSPKPQYVFSGRESNVTEINELIRNNRTGLRDKKAQQTPEKHYALSAPLGKSTARTTYAPSWSATTLRGSFSGAFRYQQGAQPTLMIPQLNVANVKCWTEIKTEAPPDPEGNETPGIHQAGSFGSTGTSGELQMATQQYEDGSYIQVTSDHLLLEIDEQNTDCLKENFDIEVFLIEEVDMTGKVSTPGLAASEQSKIEKLIPLKFGRRWSNIVNGVLVDDPAPPQIYNYDPTFVEHYLDIRVDREINPQVLCDSGVAADPNKCGGLDNGFLDCEERTGTSGLYSSSTRSGDTSNGPYGDDC
tara:strand:- start:4296 stop:5396 length:1101 start_codon:yes stop_codon:yes gene_type:complete